MKAIINKSFKKNNKFKKVLKILSLFTFSLLTLHSSLLADDCLAYKLKPSVFISVPEWEKTVVQPLKKMDLLHGNVVATLSEDYELTTSTTSIEDGECISLKSVNVIIGYSGFEVKIDARHIKNSCSYNAILSHEDEHIRAYLSITDDLKSEIAAAVKSAADSITPIFVGDLENVDVVMDNLNFQIQSYPDIVLLKQKISAEEEIRNKKIDLDNNGLALKQCMRTDF